MERHAKAPHEIAQAQMVLHEEAQTEFRERVKRASKGAAGLGHYFLTTQSPATTNTGIQGPVSQLQCVEECSNSNDSSNNSSNDKSSDDDSDIFPASMAGRVPQPLVIPPSVLTSRRPTLTNLGEQALQTSQTLIEQAGGQAPSPKWSPVQSTSQQSRSDSLHWVASHIRARMSLQAQAGTNLKEDVLDRGLIAEEEELRKLPTGSAVANLILHGPEGKPKRTSGQLPPSQKGLLDRLERRFSSAGQLQLNGPRSPSSPNIPWGPSSNSPWGPSSPNGPRSPSSPNGSRSLSSPNGSNSLPSPNGSRTLSSPIGSKSLSSPNGHRSPSSLALNPTVFGKGRFANMKAPPSRPGRLAAHETVSGQKQDAGSENLSGPLSAPSCIQAPSSLPTIFRRVGAPPSPTLSGQFSFKISASAGTPGGGSPHL